MVFIFARYAAIFCGVAFLLALCAEPCAVPCPGDRGAHFWFGRWIPQYTTRMALRLRVVVADLIRYCTATREEV